MHCASMWTVSHIVFEQLLGILLIVFEETNCIL